MADGVVVVVTCGVTAALEIWGRRCRVRGRCRVHGQRRVPVLCDGDVGDLRARVSVAGTFGRIYLNDRVHAKLPGSPPVRSWSPNGGMGTTVFSTIDFAVVGASARSR